MSEIFVCFLAFLYYLYQKEDYFINLFAKVYH